MDEDYMPPAPKRSTQESQKRQYRKLTTPFRSPLTYKGVERCSTVDIVPRLKPVQKSEEGIISSTHKEHPPGQSHVGQQPDHPKAGIRTPRAAAQFKSPVPHSNAAVKNRASIRLTPTVQMLEHELQLLRRAVKVVDDNDEEVLEQLVKKWTAAGREAAYDLWDLLKDVSEIQSKPSDLSNFWNRNTIAFGDTNWGWDKPADGEGGQHDEDELCVQESDMIVCEEDEPRNTMGTMLRQLRIDPETLGWDDETERFRDGPQ